jgi:hypothetical protein
MLDGHISTYFNKDTHDLFMLCIVLMCQLYRVVFYYCCSIIFVVVRLLFDFVHLLFGFCFHSILLLFHCSLLMRKVFNSHPGLYSRYSDPVVREVPVTITICASQ